ncbi:adenylate/guanylate cyclase domain-containing protein [Microlunatus soli]|uniref:Adenylate cyclase, class 3 n=1 Tax=Microlunatus soli TaxID=630515 RepID=A0A1H1RW58_9ACTN|nr:adenylate/guanylate cyclase domain-containing protein [Microlunatus soli]SDS39952.1 Adenylate cyclase, class 3 [Microlunatus soli]
MSPPVATESSPSQTEIPTDDTINPGSASGGTVPVARRRHRWRIGRPGIGIQSKLLIMLLGVSILAAVVVGAVGYVNGRDSLRDAALDHVTSVRDARARLLSERLGNIRQRVVVDSRNDSTLQATQRFTADFDDLDKSAVSAADRDAVRQFYSDTFVPTLDKRTGQTHDVDQFVPTSNAQLHLQAAYTAPYKLDYDKAIAAGDPGDGSDWTETRNRYHAYFRQLVDEFGYEDLMLLDPSGDVVYSAYAGTDLGTNVINGPYANGGLTSVYRRAMASNATDQAFSEDFSHYQPSLDVPTAWIASPIARGGKTLGVLAIQIPIERINDAMTAAGNWRGGGMGETGEAYMVGPDHLMRSVSRLLVEDPEEYQRRVVAAGTAPATARRAVQLKGSILLQPVDNPAVNRALAGQKGTIETTDYAGRRVLAAYESVDMGGAHWAIVAQFTTQEAFAPVEHFTRNLLLSIAGIILLVCLLSLVLAQTFIRPVRRLQSAVQQVSAGDLGHQIATRGNDEFGELGDAFNDMSRSLKVKQDLIEEQREEQDRLLLTMMPAPVVERYKHGEETISQDHQDVAVIYADVIGTDDLARDRGSSEALAMINEIWRSFDEVAERHGIERVRNTRTGYLASCGLTVPRIDNARRVVEFALDLQDVIARFNASYGASIGLRAGIDSGTVTSGLVSRSSVVYDMWGDAVNLAFRAQGVDRQPGIYATAPVVDKLGDGVQATAAGQIDTQQISRLRRRTR